MTKMMHRSHFVSLLLPCSSVGYFQLNKLKGILGLTDTDLNYEIAAEVTPLYQSTALSAMNDVLAGDKTPAEAWEIIDARRQELLLGEESSKSLLSSIVMQALGRPLEATNKFAKVNNEAATYDNLLEALEAKEALIAILTKSGWDEFEHFDKTFCNPWDKQSANGFLLSDERIKLYRIFLNRSVRKSEDGKLTDEMHEKVAEVKGLLGISDEQAEIEARAVFGPILQKVLQKATTEIVDDYTPELVVNMQKEVDEVMENYRLSDTFLQEVGSTFYAKAVALVSAKVRTISTESFRSLVLFVSHAAPNTLHSFRILVVSRPRNHAMRWRLCRRCFTFPSRTPILLTWNTLAIPTARACWKQWVLLESSAQSSGVLWRSYETDLVFQKKTAKRSFWRQSKKRWSPWLSGLSASLNVPNSASSSFRSVVERIWAKMSSKLGRGLP